MPEGQLAACSAQHQTLVDRLKANGTPAENIRIVPILLGHSGTVFSTHTLQNMELLGISRPHAKKCELKLHIDAIHQLHSIVQTRRYLEHLAAPSQRRPNNGTHGTSYRSQKHNLRPP